MQTFLPYPSFYESARCLDNKRLGKQRVEAWQIYSALTVPGYGWQHHPAVRMWRKNLGALCLYGLIIAKEWKKRRYIDKMTPRFISSWKLHNYDSYPPDWLGNKQFHSAHRAILLAKNYDWYKQFGWSEEPAEKVNGKWPYVWPV